MIRLAKPTEYLDLTLLFISVSAEYLLPAVGFENRGLIQGLWTSPLAAAGLGATSAACASLSRDDMKSNPRSVSAI